MRLDQPNVLSTVGWNADSEYDAVTQTARYSTPAVRIFQSPRDLMAPLAFIFSSIPVWLLSALSLQRTHAFSPGLRKVESSGKVGRKTKARTVAKQ